VRLLAAALDVEKRPAATKVSREGAGVVVRDIQGGSRHFDQVVIATHADEALTLVDRPSPDETVLLGAFRYQSNRAILHGDERLMPRDRRVWSSWNYMAKGQRDTERRVAVTYWMNLLQNIADAPPLFVSLNPIVEPRPERVHASFDYDHPIFDIAAIDGQKRLDRIQGRDRIWYCGSYCGYGFHEDALSSAIVVARALRATTPWEAEAANTEIVPVLAPAADD
jgi:predicted NAD/FAD-binding protein